MTAPGRRAVPVAAVLAAASAVVLAAGCTSDASDPAKTGSSSTTAAPTATAPTTSAASGSATTSAAPTRSPSGVVPSGTATSRPAAPISSPVSFGGDVTARIAQVRAVQATAELPGEIGGPAVAVTIRLTNGSRTRVALQPVVNLYYGAAGTPASTINGSPSKPFGSSLAAGRSAEGTYTFTLSAAQRRTVRIEFSYAPTAPVVSWRGSVA